MFLIKGGYDFNSHARVVSRLSSLISIPNPGWQGTVTDPSSSIQNGSSRTDYSVSGVKIGGSKGNSIIGQLSTVAITCKVAATIMKKAPPPVTCGIISPP